MRLGTKKDVKVVIKAHNVGAIKLINFIKLIFDFFKREKKQNKHKVSKMDTKKVDHLKQKVYSKNAIGKHKVMLKNKGRNQYGYTFMFMMVASIIFTISTLFYFYEVSHKIVDKKESIVELYKKYESIHQLNKKSEVLLYTLENKNPQDGKIYIILDSKNFVAKKAQEAIRLYFAESQQKQFYFMHNLNIILIASFFLVVCIGFRIFLLIREKNKILVDMNQFQYKH